VYARNLAEGNGLVFNPGEMVEGYTNFLWVLIHAVPHLLGVDAVATSQALGWVCGLGLLVATWLLGRQLGPRRPALAHAPAPVLLAANGALAFWAVSGMETLLFALLVTLGTRAYLAELSGRGAPRVTGLVFGLAALTRPEGLLFFGLTCLHRLARDLSRRPSLAARPLWRRLDLGAHLAAAIPFLVLVGPHLAFRLVYYGHPLPNTFYTKTGTSPAYLADGLRYAWKFLVDYGFWGAVLVAPIALVWWRRQRAAHAYLALLVSVYFLYVAFAGGDTLAENRLLLPVLALVYVELQELGYRLLRGAGKWIKSRTPGANAAWAPTAAAAVLLAAAGHYTFHHARPSLRHAQRATRAHNDKLRDLVEYIHALPQARNLLVASTAIGIPRYHTEARVLDLVGLTDETVAHDPQPLPGIGSDHRLRNYNVQYVMDRAPDIFFFITGERPATPAEKALFMSRRFRQGYYMTHMADNRALFVRRSTAPLPPERIHPSGRFVELYARGLAAAPHDSAQPLLRASMAAAPADFGHAHSWLGRQLYDRGQAREAATVLEQAVAADSQCVKAHAYLAVLREVGGQLDEAVRLGRRAARLAPRSHFCRYAYGRALISAGQAREGMGEMLEALRLDANAASSTDAGFRLGLACLDLEDWRRARLSWEAVLRSDPEHAGALTGLRELDRAGL